MSNYHENNRELKLEIQHMLRLHGIDVNADGQIFYTGESAAIQAKAVYLMRHAETIGTQNHEFMGNTSVNAHICEEGRRNIITFNNNIQRYHFDYIIVCCNIPRVLETAAELSKIVHDVKFHYANDFYGINNGGWEGKTPNDLCGIDYKDYLEREEKKNIFAHSPCGTSWGQVLLNCDRLISFINKNFKSMRLLLISQGSVLQGLKILTHYGSSPWGDYDSKIMFNMEKTERSNSLYGKIICIYDNDNIS